MKDENKFLNLRKFNIFMGFLHFIQAIVILVISQTSNRELTTSYFSYNEQTEKLETATRGVFDINFVWIVVGFLLLSSLFHLLVSTVGYKHYVADLKKGINRFRWSEYAFSASLMMVGIAMLTGIFDIGYLIMIFTLVAGMNLMGYMMEIHNQTTKKLDWSSYAIGCLLGIAPWIAVALQLWGSGSQAGASGPPTFVYFIFFSIFLFFNCFAINMVLQYKKVGKWSDYLYGEKVYIVLSLVAKSALAWQVYAGTLQPA